MLLAIALLDLSRTRMNTTINSSLSTKHLSTNVYSTSPDFRTKLHQVISGYLYDNKVAMWRQIFGANSSAASPSWSYVRTTCQSEEGSRRRFGSKGYLDDHLTIMV